MDWIALYIFFGMLYAYFSLTFGGLFIVGVDFRRLSDDEKAFRIVLFFLNLFVGTLIWPLILTILLGYGLYKLSSPVKWAIVGAFRHTMTLINSRSQNKGADIEG